MRTIEIITKTVEVRGIMLPWARWTPAAVYRKGKNLTPDRPDPRKLLESGEVFVPLDTLYTLSEQDVWDSQFGSALLLGVHEGLALEQAGLAVQETRGGYHRSEELVLWMQGLES